MSGRDFDLDACTDAAEAVADGTSTGVEEDMLLDWAVARLLGNCCTDCGRDTTERTCHCENDE